MTFEQLLRKAEEEADTNELITLSITQIRTYLNSAENQLEELDNALDWAQGSVFTGKNTVSYILIKIVP